MDSVYNKVLSEYYGINCDSCSKELVDMFWLELIIKNLNLNKQCKTNLLTQLV